VDKTFPRPRGGEPTLSQGRAGSPHRAGQPAPCRRPEVCTIVQRDRCVWIRAGTFRTMLEHRGAGLALSKRALRGGEDPGPLDAC